MTLRGARILLAGACTETGESLVEAFLALGAEVVAADRLRTRLEELRARLRHHERLWVAEADLSGHDAAAALFADVARDQPIDAAILIVPEGGRPEEAAHALPRCASFLGAALAPTARLEQGRVLVVLEPHEGGLDASGGIAPALRGGAMSMLASAAQALVIGCAERARSQAESGAAVAGLRALGARGALLTRVTALCDRSQPAAHGWLLDG